MKACHYSIWAIMAAIVFMAGAFFRGQELMLENEAKADGEIGILEDLSLNELQDVRI